MNDISTYLDTAAVAAELLADEAVGERWTEPSALSDMRIAGLAGHLARSIVLTEAFLDAEPTAEIPLSTAQYYLAGDDPTDHESRSSRRIRESGEATAAGGPTALRLAVEEALELLRTRLPTEDLSVVRRWFGRPTTTRTVLQARTLEMVVHVDDLAVSIDRPVPPLPAAAQDLTIQVLVEMARLRHGDLGVIRALSRRECDIAQALRVL